MRPLLFHLLSILVVLLSLSGCQSYQYVTVKSDLNNNDVGEYYIENDTVKVFFLFTGANGPVIIEVINKLDQPLYVNWKNSALIVDGKSHPLWMDIADVNINTDGVAYSYPNGQFIGASSSGTITKKEPISFLPPATSVINDNYKLAGRHIDIPKSHRPHKFTLPSANGFIDVKKYEFAPDNSPMSFRLFLTYATDEQQKTSVVLDEAFWISEIITTDLPPESFPKNPSNRFYVSKPTGFAKASAYIIGIPVLIGLAALGAQ